MVCRLCWANFSIPCYIRPPSHNGYLVHRSKVGSIVAVCHRYPLPRILRYIVTALLIFWQIYSDFKTNIFTFYCCIPKVKLSKVPFYCYFWNFSWDILRLLRQLTSSTRRSALYWFSPTHDVLHRRSRQEVEYEWEICLTHQILYTMHTCSDIIAMTLSYPCA